MENKGSGREKNVTGGGKGVNKRGDGLSTGPVGRKDGYGGRKTGVRPVNGGSSGGDSGERAAGGFGGMKLIIMIIALLLGGGGGALGLLGGGGNSGGSSSNSNSSSSPLSLFSGLGSSSGSSEAWKDGVNNTGSLNRSVASGTPSKRTTIKGNGEDTVTMMIYMCGTDLESRSGMASNDLMEICKANASPNMNIIIYTGGCTKWKTSGISNSTNQIYKVQSGGLATLVADDGDKPMTDPATLTAFIKYCNQNFPANRNELIFWDHGGGSISGYGYDEKHKSSGSMTLAGINTALKNAGATFDFIGFDTCLMATLENCLMIAPYADYIVASEETEPGIGWYYTDWITAFAQNTSMPTIEVGQKIVDSFVDECARRCPGQKATLSVVDLAELSTTVPEKLTSFSTDTADLIKSSEYKTVSDARASVREFAVSSKIDQIDLVNFAKNLGTPEAKALSDTLLSAVKYNRTSSNMTNAYGLSIYFPYKRVSSVDSMVKTYDAIGMDGDYAKCIKAFAGLETAGQISAGGTGSPLGSLLGGGSSGGTSGSDAISALLNAFMGGGKSIPGFDPAEADYMDEINLDDAAEIVAENQFDPSKMVWERQSDGSYTMSIAEDQWKLIESLQYNMFIDDGEGYVDMGLDYIYQFDDEGRLVAESDNTWLSIDGQPVAFYFESVTEDGGDRTITGYVPVMLNGERAELILVFDNAHKDGYIAGARSVYIDGETETVAKGMTELGSTDKIEFIADYYGYDSSYIDTYYLGDPVYYSSDLKISNTDVGADTQRTYLLTDIYGQEYWTPVIP